MAFPRPVLSTSMRLLTILPILLLILVLFGCALTDSILADRQLALNDPVLSVDVKTLSDSVYNFVCGIIGICPALGQYGTAIASVASALTAFVSGVLIGKRKRKKG